MNVVDVDLVMSAVDPNNIQNWLSEIGLGRSNVGNHH